MGFTAVHCSSGRNARSDKTFTETISKYPASPVVGLSVNSFPVRQTRARIINLAALRRGPHASYVMSVETCFSAFAKCGGFEHFGVPDSFVTSQI